MKRLRVLKTTCVISVFCAMTAIASPAQILTTLYNFCSQPNCTDGALPEAGLVQATDGNLYGTTFQGGANTVGTVFKITVGGTLNTLYSFCSQPNCTDGALPVAGLIQARDGNFYGTSARGGAEGSGTVFKINPSGVLNTLYSFCSQPNCNDGNGPIAGLVQGSDRNFYGTTENGGGPHSDGTVFRITPSGMLTTLYSFCSNGGSCPDGANPYEALVQGSDGNFYGTTYFGGAGDNGTVFKITPSGTLTTLHRFAGYPDDGGLPHASLVQATDGNFYGTTSAGGDEGYGTVFKITPGGVLTTLHSFNSVDGNGPLAGLVQGSDGNFYGTTSAGGASGNCRNGCGTVFKITASGMLTTLHNFDGSDGNFPYGALVQATDGNFYGTTTSGGAYGDGTVFRLVLPRPCIVCLRTE